MYPNRYEKEPRKRKPYEEAYDMITIYGLERKAFNYKKYRLSRTEMKEIWAFAKADAQGKSRYALAY